MTKAQITKAIRGEGDATDQLIASLRTADDDQMLVLLEQITAAARGDAANDIAIDLRDFGQEEAAEIVKANYL